ncbi:MAG: TonB-dependent receptor [Rhodospirillales bacterium]|nr:TonB-dependent receptor [Rhodospirillales bacterium]
MPQPGVRGRLGVGYVGNCDKLEAFGTVNGRQDGFFGSAVAYHEEVDNYKDGKGDEVRYGFDKTFATATLGYAPKPGTSISLMGAYLLKEDIVFDGSRTDTPEIKAPLGKLKLSFSPEGGWFDQIRLSGFVRGFERRNNNFELRPLTAPRAMQIDLDRFDLRGRMEGDFAIGEVKNSIGIAFEHDNRDALRSAGPDSTTMVPQSQFFPDATVNVFSLFGNSAWPLGEGRRIEGGLRYDHVRADAGNIDTQLGVTPSPETQYQNAFGVSGHGTKTENNVGAHVRYEHGFMKGSAQAFVEVGRYMRTADPQERFFARFDGPAGQAVLSNWVGNPEIDPEAHHKVEVGAALNGGSWDIGGTAYYDYALDYIIRDRAHLQTGVLLNDSSNIYRNIDASIFAIAAEANWRFATGWSVGIWGQYVHGENESDGIPLAQIPPLEGQLRLAYGSEHWSAGGRLRAVARQTRVDDDVATGSGVDDGETSEFVTLDLFAAVHPVKWARLDFGVENVFDVRYREHIERVDQNDPLYRQPASPGLAGWVRAEVKF